MRKNKRGNIIAIVVFIGIILLLLLFGLIMAFGGVTLNWVFDEFVPEIEGLGTVGDANMTSISQSTFTPVNNMVQSFTWLSGVLLAMGFIASLGFAFAFRFTGNKYLMAFFFGCMLILLLASIFVSNIYEDFYDDSGDVGTRLHEFTLLSYMILYSPVIVCIVGFIGGVIMFTGSNLEGEA